MKCHILIPMTLMFSLAQASISSYGLQNPANFGPSSLNSGNFGSSFNPLQALNSGNFGQNLNPGQALNSGNLGQTFHSGQIFNSGINEQNFSPGQTFNSGNLGQSFNPGQTFNSGNFGQTFNSGNYGQNLNPGQTFNSGNFGQNFNPGQTFNSASYGQPNPFSPQRQSPYGYSNSRTPYQQQQRAPRYRDDYRGSQSRPNRRQYPSDIRGRFRVHPKQIQRFQKYYPGPPICKCQYPEDPLKNGPFHLQTSSGQTYTTNSPLSAPVSQSYSNFNSGYTVPSTTSSLAQDASHSTQPSYSDNLDEESDVQTNSYDEDDKLLNFDLNLF